MKRIVFVMLLIACSLLPVGCSNKQVEEPNEPAPSIVIDSQHFYAPNMPISELPEGYEYIGVLSEDAANGTGLEGCKMYALKENELLSVLVCAYQRSSLKYQKNYFLIILLSYSLI